MRRPNSKTKLIRVRVTEKEFNRIRMLAAMYANSVVSDWIRYAAIEAPRRHLPRK